jgi:hypothetical protein
MRLRPGWLFIVCALAVAPAAPASAQERPVEEADLPGGQTRTDEERLYDELVAQFQREYLRFTALIQVAPVLPFQEVEGNQGRIEVSRARLGIGGFLGGGVGYRLQTELTRGPSVLDAYISYGSEDVRVLLGRQRIPFSAEALTSAADIPFVNRSRAVRALAPGREVGVEVQAERPDGPLSLRAGVFNARYRERLDGGGEVPQEDRGGVLVVARGQGTAPVGRDGELAVGANAAYDTPDASERVEVPGRLLVGADARARVGDVRLGAEVVAERVDGTDVWREGGYATAGYDLTPTDRALVRYDVFGGTEQLLFGYNRAVTRAASFQVNLAVPLDEAAEPLQALANFQLAF